ncbi:MAG: uridine kinase [Christensenellaceae bacterium]|nr:uridine kinase [Christensenellaceae bacterium]
MFAAIAAAWQAYKAPGTAILAIDGRCGSGKTTLAGVLGRLLPCTVLHMDDFFQPPALRTKERLARAGENIHHERFLQEVLLPLSEGRPAELRRFDCATGTFLDAVPIPPAKLYVVEGSYSLHPSLFPHYTHRLFLDIPPEEQKKRLLAREGEEGIAPFLERWIPLEEAYFNACGLPGKAGVVTLGITERGFLGGNE